MKCATSLPVGLRAEAFVGEGGCGDCDKTEKGICRGVYRRRPFLRGGTGAGVSTAGDLGVVAGTVVVGAGDAAKELPNLGLSANDDFEAGREPLTRRAGVGMSLWPQQCPAGEDKLGGPVIEALAWEWILCGFSRDPGQRPGKHGPRFPRCAYNQRIREAETTDRGRPVWKQRVTSQRPSKRPRKTRPSVSCLRGTALR